MAEKIETTTPLLDAAKLIQDLIERQKIVNALTDRIFEAFRPKVQSFIFDFLYPQPQSPAASLFASPAKAKRVHKPQIT